MADMHRITYDSAKEDSFLVHTKSGITKFVRDGRVYNFTPSNEFMKRIAEKRGINLPDVTTIISNLQESENLQGCAQQQEYPVEINNTISSVSENWRGYTDCEFE